MNKGLSGVLEIVRLTDVGLMREHNEDAVASDESYGFMVLADGMGGYKAGEVASEIAVLSITAELTEAIDYKRHQAALQGQYLDLLGDIEFHADMLKNAVKHANESIYQVSTTVAECQGMGTTLVLGIFVNNQLLVGHVGDSRLYRLRQQKLSQLTEDHSLLQEQIKAGLMTVEQARFSPHKNLVTRALGVDAAVELELREYVVEVGDIYLLCSDGLSDLVDDLAIEAVLNTCFFDLEQAAQMLVQMANDNGGLDNISVILVRVKQSFESKPLGDSHLKLRGSGDGFFGWLK
jgi:serine/threonine protein phosphatase PrpC